MEMLFLGLSGAAWFVVLVVILVFVLQLCTKLPSDFVFLGGMALLLVSGVIPANKVLGGFSSSTVVLIGVLFVVIKGLVQTGFMQWVVRYCLGTPKNYHRAIARLMLPVAALSSFLNNTTVVALFTGVFKYSSLAMQESAKNWIGSRFSFGTLFNGSTFTISRLYQMSRNF